MSGWLLLLVAILMEVCGTTCLKMSEQFTRLVPSALMFAFYITSLAALNFALRSIDLSVAYAVWSALGIMLVSMVSMAWFKEPVSGVKIAFLALIIVGVVGLQLTSPHKP